MPRSRRTSTTLVISASDCASQPVASRLRFVYLLAYRRYEVGLAKQHWLRSPHGYACLTRWPFRSRRQQRPRGVIIYHIFLLGDAELADDIRNIAAEAS